MTWLEERLYPELRHLADPSERAEAWREYGPTRPSILFFVFLAFVIAVGIGILDSTAPNLIGRRLVTLALAGSLIGGLGAGIIQVAEMWIRRNGFRRFLRKHLNERGIHLCLACGYDLRGQTTPRCPECGKAFDPERVVAKADSDAEQ